jgi:hypothetical protein
MAGFKVTTEAHVTVYKSKGNRIACDGSST